VAVTATQPTRLDASPAKRPELITLDPALPAGWSVALAEGRSEGEKAILASHAASLGLRDDDAGPL
jgi:hypothetical protein